MDDLISRQAVLNLLHALPPEEVTTKAMLIQSVKQMDAAQPSGPDNLVKDSQGLAKDLVNDCISRKAALDALEKSKEIYFDRQVIIGAMKGIVRNLPSAQPKSYREGYQAGFNEGYQAGFKDAQLEQPWIPCSERLPEDEQPILFSTTTGRVHQGRFHRDNSVNRWYSSLDKMRAYNNVVNAWMPLPEPYKEDDHEAR